MVEPFEINHVDLKGTQDALITNAWPLLDSSPGVHQDRYLQPASSRCQSKPVK